MSFNLADHCDPEYLLELIHQGMVEGGYMPDAFEGAEPPRNLLIEQTRAAILYQTHNRDAADMCDEIKGMLLTIMNDEPFLLALCSDVFNRGWSVPGYTFKGRKLECCLNQIEGSTLTRLTEYMEKLED